jgi:beta-galactosidase/beta-glucuronidase
MWTDGLTDSAATTPPAKFDSHIRVPYPYESALSGIGEPSPTTQRLWYSRRFSVPIEWIGNGQRLLLHFGAVNWDSTVNVNGMELGEHRGGFDGFYYDITDAMKPGNNTLVVSAWNPLLIDVPDAQIVGKQRTNPGGIFYTGATGIWQSVWVEPVPATHIERLNLVPDIDAKVLRITVDVRGDLTGPVTVTAMDGVKMIAEATGTAGTEIALPIANPHLWSPEDPFLYGLHVALGGDHADSVDSYFAMRKVSLGKDAQGRTRIFLNNHFVFEVGALDQGYWPDGIYTAPTDEALRFDIESARKFGFNLLRKHAKVEPERWYYWADKLGMLVWQDMPQCFGPPRNGSLSDAAKAQWLTEWRQIIAARRNHPCIIVWTTFNEGWGQHDTESIVALTRQLDPSRLVNDASGWVDKGVGDIHDTHAYPGPWCEMPENSRACVNGEFGGVTMRVPDHMWTTKVYGYGATLGDARTVTQKYQDLLKHAYALRDERGASAVVYTQLTDVESESNGLMTYDRAVIKPLVDIMAAANRGGFLPLPPRPTEPETVPTTTQVGGEK